MLDCLNPNGFSESKTHPGKLMEQYIESGSYKQLKELSFEHDELHKRISAYFMEHEAKRHEIGYNLVAKFVTRNVFQYDYVGLNQYLYDLGLLQKVTKISGKCIKQHDLLDLFDAFRSEPEYYIKPSLNKAGREMVKMEPPTDFPFTLEEAAKKKRENMERLKPAKFDYQILKKQLLKCGQLISEQVVKHKYGSISRLQKPCHYDVSQITDHRAIQALIEFGKPKMEQLDFYMVRGFISKSEVDSFRELTDIKLEFVILDIAEEAAMLSNLYQKKMNRFME